MLTAGFDCYYLHHSIQEVRGFKPNFLVTMVFLTTLHRTATTSVVTLSLALGTLASIARAVPLNGAGASFPAPLYQRYATEIKEDHPDIQINYQAIGSGGGIRQTIAGTVDFGGSDAAMKDSEIAKVKATERGGIILVPTAGGAVAVPYNLPGVTDLNIPRKALGRIFAGDIKKWNDPVLVAANPGVNLPDRDIRVVVRADSSGTTFIFTNHLATVDGYFRSRVLRGRKTGSKKPNWPGVTLKGPKNAGVAALVAQTPGSIGYVEYDYAKQNNLAVAAVENQEGHFVKPSLEEVSTALANITFPSNFRVFVGDPADGYPIVGLTWMMVYENYATPAKANSIKRMVEWILTDGQDLNGAPPLNYTRIPAEVAREAIKVVKSKVR